MKIKIECEIEVDETLWFNDEEEKEWFIECLNDEENTMLILWSNEAENYLKQFKEQKKL